MHSFSHEFGISKCLSSFFTNWDRMWFQLQFSLRWFVFTHLTLTHLTGRLSWWKSTVGTSVCTITRFNLPIGDLSWVHLTLLVSANANVKNFHIQFLSFNDLWICLHNVFFSTFYVNVTVRIVQLWRSFPCNRWWFLHFYMMILGI